MKNTSNLERRRRQRQRGEFAQTLSEAVQAGIKRLLSENDGLGSVAAQVESGELDPYSAAAQVLDDGGFLSQLQRAIKAQTADSTGGG
jgi:putative protein kinase ArgK-like GTPase of G3E family